MAPHQKSLIREVLDRLEERLALGESRGQAKEATRAAGASTWAFSTGKMHSLKTRSVYQEQSLTFANWVRDTYDLKQLVLLEERADELVTAYLEQHLREGKSPSTLHTIRPALRLLFGDRTLAASVELPRRTRASITRSRGEKRHDRYFQPANWQPLLAFLRATGLRRDEATMLKVGDILDGDQVLAGVSVFVANGKGGKARTVPVLVGHEQAVLALKAGRATTERVFTRIPRHLDVHVYRREYAQSLYLQHAPGRSLPSPTGRLRPQDYDRPAAQHVSEALGHHRIDDGSVFLPSPFLRFQPTHRVDSQ